MCIFLQQNTWGRITNNLASIWLESITFLGKIIILSIEHVHIIFIITLVIAAAYLEEDAGHPKGNNAVLPTGQTRRLPVCKSASYMLLGLLQQFPLCSPYSGSLAAQGFLLPPQDIYRQFPPHSEYACRYLHGSPPPHFLRSLTLSHFIMEASPHTPELIHPSSSLCLFVVPLYHLLVCLSPRLRQKPHEVRGLCFAQRCVFCISE